MSKEETSEEFLKRRDDDLQARTRVSRMYCQVAKALLDLGMVIEDRPSKVVELDPHSVGIHDPGRGEFRTVDVPPGTASLLGMVIWKLQEIEKSLPGGHFSIEERGLEPMAMDSEALGVRHALAKAQRWVISAAEEALVSPFASHSIHLRFREITDRVWGIARMFGFDRGDLDAAVARTKEVARLKERAPESPGS